MALVDVETDKTVDIHFFGGNGSIADAENGSSMIIASGFPLA